MVSNRGVAEQKLSFEIERNKLQQALKSIKDLWKGLQKTEDQLEAVGDEAKTSAKLLDKWGDVGANSAKKVTDEMEKLARAQKEAQAERLEAVGDVGGGFGAASTLLSSVGLTGLGEATGLIDDLLTVAENLPKFSEGLKQITGASQAASAATGAFATAETAATGAAAAGVPAMTAFGVSITAALGPLALIAVAIAAVAVAFKAASATIKEAKEGLETALDAQRSYFELVETGSQEEIQNAIKSQEATLAARKAEQAALEAQIKNLNLFAKIFTQADKALNDQLKDTEKSINSLNAELGALQDAADNPKVKARSQEIEKETRVVVKSTQAERARNAELKKTPERLKQVAKAERIQAKQSELMMNGIRKSQGDAVKAQIDARRALSAKLIDLARNEAKASIDARKNLERDLNRQVEQLSQSRADAVRRSFQDDAKSARDLQRDLQKIRRDGERDIKDAIRDRDFARAAEVSRGIGEQMSERTQQFNAEREERQIALDQQLGDIKLNAQRQRAERIKNFRLQLSDIRNNTRRARAEAIQAARAELGMTRNKLQQKLGLEGQYWNASLGLVQSAMNNVGGIASSRGVPIRGGGGASTYTSISAPVNQTINAGPNMNESIIANIAAREVQSALRGVGGF